MIAEDLLHLAGTNLVETYLQLGLATPEAVVMEDEVFIACLGSYPHPICNFAVRLRLDPWSARRLQAVASARSTFHVYVLPEDQPTHLAELLARADFGRIYALESMAWEGGAAEASIELAEATDPITRLSTAQFMTRQFFGRQTEEFQSQVRQATSGAEKLGLYHYADRGKTLGAVMLSRTPGTLGVYNLCVLAGSRRRGVGTRIARWCQSVAVIERRTVVLQCDSSLAAWYSKFGFRSLGRVEVFSLLKPDSLDIIEVGSVYQRV